MAVNSKTYQNIKMEVEQYLSTALKTKQQLLHPFVEAMNYSLLAGGKRLRAVLLVQTAEICGLEREHALPFAAAMEMIHAYSLIHDDLPAMDDDDYRRGKLSSHKQFGEATAILAGDGLLNYAYELMLAQCSRSGKQSKLKAATLIATAAGINGMLGGQVVDIDSEKKDANADRLDFIHRYKTAALIIAAVEAGAVLAETSTENINNFKAFAHYFGMAFQISDDILDYTGDSTVLGKTVGSDQKSDKLTYVSLYGIDKAKQLLAEAITAAENELEKINLDTSFLRELTLYLAKRQY